MSLLLLFVIDLFAQDSLASTVDTLSPLPLVSTILINAYYQRIAVVKLSIRLMISMQELLQFSSYVSHYGRQPWCNLFA